jgi:acyl-CoA synthetase (AMP-forming)/AMP-acid ligase II
MNLLHVTERNARFYPEKEAFVEIRPLSRRRLALTWREFDEKVQRFANGLIERGLRKGERVFILGRNSIDWLVCYFGTLLCSAWAVPLNYRFYDEDLFYCAEIAKPSFFVMDAEYAPRVQKNRGRFDSVRHYISIGETDGMESLDRLLLGDSPRRLKVPPSDDEECALYFTSGTTGAPKPILLTHRNLMSTAINEAVAEKWDERDCLLMMPPFYHLAIGHLFGCMISGGKTVLLTERISPEFIFETISKERVTVVFLLVPWIIDVLEALDSGRIRKGDYDLAMWRLVYSGAQPIPPNLVLRWKQHFPQMAFDCTYGLSEASGPQVTHLGLGNERKMGSIGKPGLLWDVRIVDDEGRDVPKGEVGELVARGDGVMRCYFNNPDLTAKTIQDGWLRTGDLARMDEEGFIYIVDRKKDVIICGGENVYPVEVETVISRHPKVRDVAVIGTRDERLGEVVTAVIEAVPGADLTEEEILRFCEENLPRYKRPRRIIFDTIPRSSTGKIEKPKLRERWGGGR